MSLTFTHPFTCIVSGPSGCGKTEFTIRLINNVNKLIKPSVNRIIWCYGIYQERFADIENVHFHEGLPSMQTFENREPTLLILDDLMRELSSSSAAVDLFTKGSHHMNLSVIFMTQNIFYKGKESRTMSLNTHYFVLFKNPRDAQQVSVLARQVFGTKWRYMLEAFADATTEPYSYLLVDLKPQTEDRLRLRANIFPGETNFVYVSK
jgi:hypothetical protein